MNNIQNRVPVVDAEHHPLAPCSPRRARTLVKQGKANGRHQNGIYYLTLHRTIPQESIQSAHLMIDPGKSFTGLAIVRDDEQCNRTVLFCGITRHRNDVRKRLAQRSIVPPDPPRPPTFPQAPILQPQTPCRLATPQPAEPPRQHPHLGQPAFRTGCHLRHPHRNSPVRRSASPQPKKSTARITSRARFTRPRSGPS